MTADGAEVARRRLESPLYQPLWAALRERLERTGLSVSNRPLKVEVLGESRVAIAGLLGLSPAGTDALAVRPDRLDAVLRSGKAQIGLLDLLESIGGPLVDRRAARAERAAIVSASWRSLAGHKAIASHPRLTGWLDALRANGTALRLAGSIDAVEPLVQRCLDVVMCLPATGVPLAVFAADTTGDAHALDRSSVLGTLVASSLAYLDVAGSDRSEGQLVDGPGASWRDAWARVGVFCDDVSVSVLVLNLDVPGGAGPVSATLAGHARAGLPLRLTLQQLRSERLGFAPGTVVRSCENPSVVARAAAALGAGAGPLVCTDGQPNGAVDELMGQLRGAGVSVSHHGDFDWGGIRIANTLVARHGVGLWRFAGSDYREVADLGRLPLDEPRTEVFASWDPDLVPMMRAVGVRVFEEQVIETLLTDLAR